MTKLDYALIQRQLGLITGLTMKEPNLAESVGAAVELIDEILLKEKLEN